MNQVENKGRAIACSLLEYSGNLFGFRYCNRRFLCDACNRSFLIALAVALCRTNSCHLLRNCQ